MKTPKVGRDAAQRQVSRFLELIRPMGVTLYVREEAGRCVVFAQLPERNVRNDVLKAQSQVALDFDGLAFELILLYPEDLRRPGMEQFVQTATRI